MKRLNQQLRYNSRDINYYKNVRRDLVEYVMKGNSTILDVGCGEGYFGEYLKSHGYASKVVGIELNAFIAKEASRRLDQVICANLNESRVFDILKDFNKAAFDYIVCADILEHLIEPWSVLSGLVDYLKPDGRVIVSLPNVRNWSVWLPLVLFGNWEYRESGIMDRTHLRYFTRLSAKELLVKAGLDVAICKAFVGGKWHLINKYTMGLLEEMIASQLLLIGVYKLGRDGLKSDSSS